MRKVWTTTMGGPKEMQSIFAKRGLLVVHRKEQPIPAISPTN